MIACLVALAFQSAPIVEAIPSVGDGPKCEIRYSREPLATPRLDPKFRIEHPYEVKGYLEERGAMQERLFVFVSAADRVPLAALAARQMLRMLAYAKSAFGFDLPLGYGRQLHVFLTDAGEPGGEQGVFEGLAPQGGVRSYHCVYVYDVESFTEPVEMARELAHEFGHAVLPAVGGFERPERWANGMLGELVFLRFLAQEVALSDRDRMGAGAGDLQKYWHTALRPHVERVFLRGPRISPEEGKTEMVEYVGMMGVVLEAFPTAFARAMLLTGGTSAFDAEQGVLRAIGERNEWTVRLPEWLGSAAVYIPAPGDWRVEGAKVLARKSDWIKIQPLQNPLVLRRASE